MAILLSAQDIEKSHGSQLLFSDLSFGIESGQKIGLIGPNGAGKSTLLRLLSKRDTLDAGKLNFGVGLRLGYLEQNPRFKAEDTVYQAIVEATDDPYEYDNIALASELISRLELDGPQAGNDRPVAELSGGWQKRVALGRELARRPDLLLLDEPTNHLDVEAIEWLEDEIGKRHELAILMVTHDRLFLQNTCDLIFDLDRRNPDGLIKFSGAYADFVDFKNAGLAAQKTLEEKKRNTLRRETAWLRRGAKARQTKQKARIERAGDLGDEVDLLKEKNRERRVNIDFGEVGRNPKKIIEAKKITKRDGERFLFRDFDFILAARSRVALLGPNGCGKTTLIRSLLGETGVDSGSVMQADGMSFAVFEQRKESLQPGISVLKTLLPEGDYVDVKGQSVYARSYLSRFHFRSDQMDLPVEKLSGGEQTRLMLARLMLRKDPVLILDEPTNDLDIETLETLQEALNDFPGAVILVTHDRYFMDQVADEILAFTGDGEIQKFASLFQWEEWRKTRPAENARAKKKTDAAPAAPKPKGRLSFKEQHEWDGMEKAIQDAELLLQEMQTALAAPDAQSDYARLQELTAKMQMQQSAVDRLYARWTELSEKVGG